MYYPGIVLSYDCPRVSSWHVLFKISPRVFFLLFCFCPRISTLVFSLHSFVLGFSLVYFPFIVLSQDFLLCIFPSLFCHRISSRVFSWLCFVLGFSLHCFVHDFPPGMLSPHYLVLWFPLYVYSRYCFIQGFLPRVVYFPGIVLS